MDKKIFAGQTALLSRALLASALGIIMGLVLLLPTIASANFGGFRSNGFVVPSGSFRHDDRFFRHDFGIPHQRFFDNNKRFFHHQPFFHTGGFHGHQPFFR